MPTVEIRSIDVFTKDDRKELGINGYVAESTFKIIKNVTENQITLKATFQPTLLDYIKEFEDEGDDYYLFDDIIKKGYSYGAFIDDELVGVIIVDPRKWNNSLFIAEIEVSDKYRNEGIGKDLVRVVEEKALERGFRAIGVETQNTNVPAIRFFQSMEFEIAGIDTSLYDKNDLENEEVALFMRKYLM